MSVINELSPLQQDYRRSHLEKGVDYDGNLAQSPLDDYMVRWEQRYLSDTLGCLYSNGPQRYLDFACGTGRITELIAPLAKVSIGVDISPTMIDVARKKCPGTHFQLADLTQQHFELGEFDLITSFRFFGNAQDELREAAMRAISGRLVKGGHLVMNSHRNPRALFALFDRATGGSSGSMDLHLAKLRRLLKRHGMSIIALQPIGVWMYRAKLLGSIDADDDRALRNEARFSSRMFAGIAPNLIVVAKKR